MINPVHRHRVYILGPMTGYPDENRPAFRAAAKMLRSMGAVVISPDELDEMYPIHEPNWEKYLRRDLPFVAKATVGVALPGWRASRGATLEATVISQLGGPIYELRDGMPGFLFRPRSLPVPAYVRAPIEPTNETEQ